MKKTLSQLAESMLSAFVRDTRTNGEPFEKLDSDNPNYADWMQDVVREAHCDMMPDDMRYKMIRECLNVIVERLDNGATDFDDMDMGEIADSLVDIYNWDRLKWLSSSLYRAQYCDDAQDEGLTGDDTTMFERIGAGQYQEYSEILHTLSCALLDVFAEQEEE